MVSLVRRWQAFVCPFAILLSLLLIHPQVEMGLIDDWSYIKMVQVLAASGRIVYNGWESPIVGWQLLLGIPFVKLFGFSFTAVRMSMPLVAMATAFLLHRTFVRIGVSDWNATIGTSAFVLSPLYLPLSLTFMTDVPGVFSTLCTLYACIRALQAETDGTASAWLVAASVSSLVGGTDRQVVWLGCLVMVPCATWILRNRRPVLVTGILVSITSAALVALSMRWFARQPFTLSADILPSNVHASDMLLLCYTVVAILLPIALFSLPFLVLFIPYVWVTNRRSALAVAVGSSGVALFAASLARHHKLTQWLVPDRHGVLDGLPIFGDRPVVLPIIVSVVVTSAIVAGLLGLSSHLSSPHGTRKLVPPGAITDSQLAVLLLPFTVAYLSLILMRFQFALFERYELIVIMLALLLLIRYHQSRISPRLPWVSVGLVALIALYTVIATHDAFAMFRARAKAIQELRAAHVPATWIDGGLEYDGWTQIEQTGFVNDPRVRLPTGASPQSYVSTLPPDCQQFYYPLVPAITPHYALSFDPRACAGQSDFPPVTYYPWLGPRPVEIYIIRTGSAPST